MAKIHALEYSMRVGSAMVQVRFMHADAQKFQKAIATAMETSWMNVVFVVEPVFRMATVIVMEVNWMC
jgi:7-keto-8-aminopelargonate synthetase-like enzyme